VHEANPYYGVARFALELGWSEKKARRIRNLSGISVAKRTKKRKAKQVNPEIVAPGNVRISSIIMPFIPLQFPLVVVRMLHLLCQAQPQF
jgi:hypothetical protein